MYNINKAMKYEKHTYEVRQGLLTKTINSLFRESGNQTYFLNKLKWGRQARVCNYYMNNYSQGKALIFSILPIYKNEHYGRK